MDELRWILAGIGVLILCLIYLWGIRARIKEQLRERRLRAARLSESEPVLGSDQSEGKPKVTELDFGHLGKVGPDHHLADKILVDVEITPVQRSSAETAGEAKGGEFTAEEAKPLDELSSAVSHPEPSRKERKEQEDLEAAKLPQMTVLLTVTASQGRSFRGSQILEVFKELDLRLSKMGVFDCFKGDQEKPVLGIGHLREPGTFALDSIETLLTPGLLLFMHLPGPLGAVAAVDFMLAIARRLAQKLDGNVCDERRNKMTAQSINHLRSEAVEFERQLRLQQARR